MSTPTQPNYKFLPVREIGEAIPIGTLIPYALKESVRERYLLAKSKRSYVLPGYLKVLNDVVQRLGFGCDFGEYLKKYDRELLPFLELHGLREQKCLLAGDDDAIVRLRYRQIADRLFASGLAHPSRIFTGHGLDYWDFLDTSEKQNGLTVSSIAPDLTERTKGPRRKQQFPPQYFEVKGAGGTLQYLDTFCFNNFLGQQLCAHKEPLANSPLIATLYRMSTEEKQKSDNCIMIFRRVITALNAGWMDVMPYPHSKNLIFLADGHGGYDFVFRNMRDAPPEEMHFDAKFPAGFSILPDEDRKFEAYSYFDYEGWREFDQHEAEQAFYAKGGTPATYPGETNVLRAYLDGRGHWSAAPGVTQLGKRESPLIVTSLISINEMRNFFDKNSKYFLYPQQTSNGDPWIEANGGGNEDASLPAAVSHDDAVAYAAWATSQGPKNYRLLTEEEYHEHFSDLLPDDISENDIHAAFQQKLCRFEGPNGEVFDGHPPYMPVEDFAKIRMRYIQPLPWKRGKSGTELVASAYFGEWLAPKNAAINGLFFCAQREIGYAHKERVSPSRARFASGSTGKYKGMKIGFRLVVED